MVSWTGDGGVVAISRNTDVWPCYERTAASRLMAEKCPDGYEIVEESEFVVGQTTTTTSTGGDKISLVSVQVGPGGGTPADTVTTTANQTEYRLRFRPKNATTHTTLPPHSIEDR